MIRIIKKIKGYLFHYYSICRYPLYRSFYYFPKVESIEQTLERILENRLSIARFGDGELSLLHHNNIGFQSFNENLKIRLQEIILDYNNDKCLIGIPSSLHTLDNFTKDAKIIFKSLIGGYYQNYKAFLNTNHIYPNAFITRFYMDYEDKDKANNRFVLLKKIWNDRKVVIIEGEFTRFGVGNDLLSNAYSIERVLVPSKNAFDYYENIVDYVKQNVHQDTLILAAIGPTATVLCYDLAQLNYQSIDVGHADIEYEWFLKKAKRKVPISNKAVNEVKNGLNITPNEYEDIDYIAQIKTTIL